MARLLSRVCGTCGLAAQSHLQEPPAHDTVHTKSLLFELHILPVSDGLFSFLLLSSSPSQAPVVPHHYQRDLISYRAHAVAPSGDAASVRRRVFGKRPPTRINQANPTNLVTGIARFAGKAIRLRKDSSPATAAIIPSTTNQRGNKRAKWLVTETPAARRPKATAKPTPPNKNDMKYRTRVAMSDADTSGTESTHVHKPEMAIAPDAAKPPKSAMFVPAARTPR